MSKDMYVYILMSGSDGPIYIGVTNDLARRLLEHKNGTFDGFTKKYHLNKLVYYEHGTDPIGAIAREKQLKNWHRDWKLNLIFSQNPNLKDLSDEVLGK